jgi:hypothetical protein
MTLDEVDIQVLLLDQYAAARSARRGRKEETVEEAIAGAMEGGA